jgi:ketosteroid isomerase-like protein
LQRPTDCVEQSNSICMYIQNLLISICLIFTGGQDANHQKNSTKDIASAVEKLRVAIINADQAALMKLTSPVLTYGHSNGSVEDQSTFVQSLMTGKYNFLTITLLNQKVIKRDNLAIVRHDLVADTKDRDKPEGVLKLHVMMVWKFEGKDWVLIGRQAVKN